MKKFIFGVMLLVSLLGIVGCSNPSNSDGSEDVTYIVKNATGSEITISYEKKSGEPTKRTIPDKGVYEIPANEAKKATHCDVYTGKEFTVIFLNISGDAPEITAYIMETNKGVQIKQSSEGYCFEQLTVN